MLCSMSFRLKKTSTALISENILDKNLRRLKIDYKILPLPFYYFNLLKIIVILYVHIPVTYNYNSLPRYFFRFQKLVNVI